MTSISVELKDTSAKNKSSTTTWYNHNKSSFFFIETDKVITTATAPPEFVLGYTRNIYNWVRTFRKNTAGYLLILKFHDSDTAGRDFWRALQDLPELRDAKTGISDQETHKHTFPRYRIRGRILAGLVAKQVAGVAAEIVTDLPEFMVG